MKKSWILIPITIVLALSNAVNVFASEFTDMDQLPWSGAEVYIEKAYDLGLMTGDTDSKGNLVFRGKDSVTCCEVMQLTYSLLKSTEQAQQSENIIEKWKTVLEECRIPEWAWQSIAFGLENNIITQDDISVFVDKNGVNKKANRQESAVIFGKALSQYHSIDTGASLSFSDSASVSTEAVPYVALLVKLGVLTGDDNNNFNPTQSINRAEIAVIITRAYTALNESTAKTEGSNIDSLEQTQIQEASGTVTGVEDFGTSYMISILSQGKSLGFIGDDTVPVTLGSADYKFSQIGVGDEITISYEGSQINKVNVSYDAVDLINQSETINGELIDITEYAVYFRQTGESSQNYDMSDSVSYLLNSASSSLLRLQNEIDDGYALSGTITLDSEGKVSEVDVDSEEEDSLEGEITYLSSSKISIELSSGSTKTYDLIDDTDDLVVKINDSTKDYDDLKDYYDDDETITVLLSLNSSDEVKRIEAETDESEDEDEYSGELTYLSETKLKIDGSSYTIADPDDVTVEVENGNEEGYITDFDELMDIIEDGAVFDATVLLEDDEIVEITGEIIEMEGELLSVNTSSDTIKIEVNSGSYEYELDYDAEIELDQESCDIDELSDMLDEYDIEVTLTLEDGYVIEISADSY